MDFRDLNTRVRINPETYLKFDGTEQLVLRNIHAEDGISIKYDIMLILYELVDWKSVGELIAPWPPGDQEKIIEHLEMLYSRQVVITDDAELSDISESGLSANLGKAVHINVENHHAMLRDYVRMAAYQRAIERSIKPDSIALDLGCGTGILSFFAARAGAKKVYAIEKRPDIIYLAEQLAKENKLDQTISFIEGSSSHIKQESLSPKPNVLISEILGNAILEENILEYTMDARDRFLEPGGQLIPYKLDIHLFAFDSGLRQSRWEEIREYKDLYGFDFELLGQVLCNKATTRTDRYNTLVNQPMSETHLIKSLDFRTLKDSVFSNKFELTALEDGQITNFCAYFKAHLDEETILTNSPWAPPTHWTQLIYTLAAPRMVKKGDILKMEVVYDGSMRVQILNP